MEDLKLLDVVVFCECCYGAEYVLGNGEVSSEEKENRASRKNGADGGGSREGENVGRERTVSAASG